MDRNVNTPFAALSVRFCLTAARAIIAGGARNAFLPAAASRARLLITRVVITAVFRRRVQR